MRWYGISKAGIVHREAQPEAPTAVITKRRSKCGEIKPITEFGKTPTFKPRSACRECDREAERMRQERKRANRRARKDSQ